MDRSTFFAAARYDLDGPLHGLRVVDATTVWSGPMAACLLADLGADVIRVERPGDRAADLPPLIPGTGLSWFHQSVNRNKRSVGLDLRRDEAREVFLALAATADVVVENFRPGTMDRWGIGYTACRAVRPDVIMLSISGWGQYGPAAQRRGYDPVVQAEGGWMALNGPSDGGPAKAPTFLADDLAGLHGAIAALAALHHRERTGEGQHVDVAMLDALLFSSDGLLTMAAAGAPPRRWGDETEFVVPSNTYECADGTVYLVAALDRQWRSLAAAIGRPDLARAPRFATNAERRRNRHEVNAVLARWCAELPAEKVISSLAGTEVVAGRVRGLAEVAVDPHIRERDMLQPTLLSDGTEAPLTGPAAKFGRTPTRVRRGAPEPGADTDEILESLGIDASVRDILRRGRASREEPGTCG